jgi:hypothetical protein
MFTRRKFISTLAGSAAFTRLAASAARSVTQRGSSNRTLRGTDLPIDRAALVRRHNPSLRKLDPLSPFSLGNGEFAFTADVTGLQSLPAEYQEAMPLCTMSQWGWHTRPAGGLDPRALRLTQYDTHGRQVGYHTSSQGQTELFNWLRENPHRLHLGRIGFYVPLEDRDLRLSELSDIEQDLDLWRGVLTSRFKFEGRTVTVRTAVHPRLDLIAVSANSSLFAESRLVVRFAFPYGSPSMQAADWTQADNHQTKVIADRKERIDLSRTLDEDNYFVAIRWDGAGKLVAQAPHSFLLSAGQSNGSLNFEIAFSAQPVTKSIPNVEATFAASAAHWRRFWTNGGAVELAGSRDPRAFELERRVVLSQYLTAIQCAGSQPPQETGLTVNSWYGKFHLEMHWWHATHFALWKRLPLFEKSLSWYESILPQARSIAQSQGYAGARWPKMVGPEGRDSPSPIGPLLIWQQPHPIFYAELCYRTHANRQTLERYRRIVFESAAFMASYAFWEEKGSRYVLGPPVIPAQENHPARETWNPTFELAYWRYGLNTAQRWRERLGLQRDLLWDHIISKLAVLPVQNGVYLAHENCPQTYTERNSDHPSMLAAYGLLSGEGVDRETMRRTLHKTMTEWHWDQTWGWDYPMTAMTAARLGEGNVAVDALLMTTAKNRYLPNGHNWQRPNLPCYLPGNGGLLYAVAMMSAGWCGAPKTHAPGFPSDGKWNVRWENLHPA